MSDMMKIIIWVSLSVEFRCWLLMAVMVMFLLQMTSSGLPELSGSHDLKYVFDALQPHNTDADATIFFTRWRRHKCSPHLIISSLAGRTQPLYTFNCGLSVHPSRLIESSLGSVATKFNFFIHNLAQLRFSGLPANDEPILSFSPKTYTLKQDGRILHASIFSFQKRYNPDKHYVSQTPPFHWALVICVNIQ